MAISSHQWQSVAISTHLDFGVTKLGMPDIDAQDDARARRVIPHLVLEGIVEDEHLVLAPRPHLSGAAVISGKQCHSAVISCHQWYSASSPDRRSGCDIHRPLARAGPDADEAASCQGRSAHKCACRARAQRRKPTCTGRALHGASS